MADTNQRAAAPNSTTNPARASDANERLNGADGLHIEIWQDEWAQFTGTAAQLQAEGLIPDGFQWPRAADDKSWEANGLHYSVCRRRPEGHKGPMRSWLEVDNWRVRVEVAGHDYQSRVRRRLDRKAEELRAEYYRNTYAGNLEWQTAFNRYWQTRKDQRFQAFKALVPGLVPPTRGRKAKAAQQIGGAA